MMKNYGKVALLLAGILLASVLLTAFTGTVPVGTGSPRRTVVTTVYPLYVAALNLLDGVEGTEAVNLTGSATGCLHDYQLSPANRITLQNAAVVVLNGAGAEAFLEDLLPELTAPVVDTSVGVTLLPAGEHHHEEHEEHEYHDDHEEYNEHIWTSPAGYARQVENLMAGLIEADPANAAAYQKNGEAYLREIDKIAQELAALKDKVPAAGILFHDSLSYLAAELGITPAVTLSMGEDSGVSAAELSQAQEAARKDPTLWVMYDSQYTGRYSTVDQAVDAKRVLTLNTGVLGTGDRRDWITAMEQNILTMKEALA